MDQLSALESQIRPPVIYLHVPKTAGTSLSNMIKSQFTNEETLSCASPWSLNAMPAESLSRYRLFHGHFDWSELERLPQPRVVISQLRDPIARILSLYWYWRSFSWDHAERTSDFGIQFAKTSSLEEFFWTAPPGIRANYENAVVRQLVGAAYCKPHVGFTIPDPEVLEIAKRRIDEMAFCGVAERFDETARRVASLLGAPALRTRRDNRLVDRRYATDSDPVRAIPPPARLGPRLKDLTRLDRAIYAYARDRLGTPSKFTAITQNLRAFARVEPERRTVG